MAAFEVIALDTATPQLRAPGASDTYTFPRAVELPLGTANGVLFLNGSKVVTSGSALTFDGTDMGVGGSPETFIKLKVYGAAKIESAQPVYFMNSDGTNNVQINNAGATGAGNGQMAFTLSGVGEQMRLTSTGLGIGTSSPGNRLHVVGASTTQVQVQMSGQADMRIISDTGYGALSLESAMPLLFRTSALERMRLDSSGNLGLGGSAARATTAGAAVLNIFNGTAPVGTLANGISIYSAAGEAYVMDAAGNATLFSPHDAETNEWIFRSKHTPTGKVLKIDVERLLRFVNDHFGLDAVEEFVER